MICGRPFNPGQAETLHRAKSMAFSDATNTSGIPGTCAWQTCQRMVEEVKTVPRPREPAGSRRASALPPINESSLVSAERRCLSAFNTMSTQIRP